MKIEYLAAAVELEKELTRWTQARERLRREVFKSATLRITDMSHGQTGVDRHVQNAETLLDIDPEHLIPFVEQQIARVRSNLGEIGITI